MSRNKQDDPAVRALLEAAYQMDRMGQIGQPNDSKRSRRSTKNRQHSLALSVPPSQAAKFREHAKRIGAKGVEFDEQGRCFLPSHGKNRKDYIKALGFVDFGT
jgi:hypothetical protein